jgi:hypothetical protein
MSTTPSGSHYGTVTLIGTTTGNRNTVTFIDPQLLSNYGTVTTVVGNTSITTTAAATTGYIYTPYMPLQTQTMGRVGYSRRQITYETIIVKGL